MCVFHSLWKSREDAPVSEVRWQLMEKEDDWNSLDETQQLERLVCNERGKRDESKAK